MAWVLRPSSEPEPGGRGQSSRSWRRLRRSCRREPGAVDPRAAPDSDHNPTRRYFYTKNITDHCCPDPRTAGTSHRLHPSANPKVLNVKPAKKRIERAAKVLSPGRVGTRHDSTGRRGALLRPGEGLLSCTEPKTLSSPKPYVLIYIYIYIYIDCFHYPDEGRSC